MIEKWSSFFEGFFISALNFGNVPVPFKPSFAIDSQRASIRIRERTAEASCANEQSNKQESKEASKQSKGMFALGTKAKAAEGDVADFPESVGPQTQTGGIHSTNARVSRKAYRISFYFVLLCEDCSGHIPAHGSHSSVVRAMVVCGAAPRSLLGKCIRRTRVFRVRLTAFRSILFYCVRVFLDLSAHRAAIAQWLERWSYGPQDPGSSPAVPMCASRIPQAITSGMSCPFPYGQRSPASSMEVAIACAHAMRSLWSDPIFEYSNIRKSNIRILNIRILNVRTSNIQIFNFRIYEYSNIEHSSIFAYSIEC